MNVLIFRGIILFVCALVNFLFVIFLWKRRDDKTSFYMGWVALFSALYTFLCGSPYLFWDGMSEHRLLLYRMTWLGIFILPALIIFTYKFIGKIRYIRIKAVVLYLLAAAFSYLALCTPYVIKSTYLNYPNIVGETGELDILGRIYILFCGVLCLYYLLREFFRTRNSLKRLQIKYFVLGLSVYLVGGIISVSVVPAITGESAYYDITAYLSTFWILLTSYAILKYRLLDIRFVLGRLAIYILCVMTFGAITLVIFSLNFSLDQIIPSNFLFGLMLLIVVLTFLPLFRLFERIAGRYFYYTYYNLQRVLQQLSGRLSQTIDLGGLSILISRSLLDALSLDRIGIIIKGHQEKEFYVQGSIKFAKEDLFSLLQDNFLTDYLKKTGRPLILDEVPFIIEERKREGVKDGAGPGNFTAKITLLKRVAEEAGVALFLPLLIKQELIGVVILGGKLSHKAYTVQDMQLLDTLSSQASVAFNNALSYSELEKKKADLEKFYQLTVGRELKMMELKKDIKKLEGKIKE